GLGNHLRRMAARRKGVPRFRGKRGGLTWCRDLAMKEIPQQWLDGWIGRIEHDKAQRTEQQFQPSRERVCHANAGPVACAQAPEDPPCELGGGQRAFELGERGVDALIESEGRDWPFTGALRFGKRDGARL